MATSSITVPTARLVSGATIPQIGFGTWKAGKGEVSKAVKHALSVGYKHLDCAADYANQDEVGEGIAAAISEGHITREDLWVTSKLWNTDHAREHVRPACEQTLKELGLDYLDLYLIHFPIPMKYTGEHSDAPRDEDGNVIFAKVSIRETWEAMEELVDAGLVKHIGVSNFSSQLIMDLLTYARIPPEVNQIELHPYLAQTRLVEFCKAHDIHVTAFSPLGSPSYVPLGMVDSSLVSLFDQEAIKTIAAKHDTTPAQVILKWGVARGTSIVPKSTNPDRIAANLASAAVPLDDEDIKAITALDRGLRFNDPINFWGVDIWAGGH